MTCSMWQESEKEEKFELRSKMEFIVLQEEGSEVYWKARERVLIQGGIQAHKRTVCFTNI